MGGPLDCQAVSAGVCDLWQKQFEGVMEKKASHRLGVEGWGKDTSDFDQNQ